MRTSPGISCTGRAGCSGSEGETPMREVRILDLDGSLTAQSSLFPPEAAELGTGARVGTADSPGLYVRNVSERFRRWLDGAFGCRDPGITFYGSGDFHHVTLALLKQVARAVQPAGPGQAPGLDEGHSVSALRNLAPAGPPLGESQPRVPLRWRARFRQRVSLARSLAPRSGPAGSWSSRPYVDSIAAAGPRSPSTLC